MAAAVEPGRGDGGRGPAPVEEPAGHASAALIGAPADDRPAVGADAPAKVPLNPPDNKSPVYMWLCQFEALFRKCCETLSRRWGALFLVLLAPTLAVLALDQLKGASYDDLVRAPFPEAIELAPKDSDGRYTLPECFIFDIVDAKTRMSCINLAYTWAPGSGTEQMAEDIVERIGAPAGVDREDAFMSFNSPEDVSRAIFIEPGKFDAVLVVDAVAGDTMSYSLWRNATTEMYSYRKFGDYFHYAHIQQAIEQAAMEAGVGSMSGNGVSVTLKKLPELSAEGGAEGMVRNYPDVIDYDAGAMLVLGLSLSVCLTVELVAQEKREGLLGLLRMTGLRESTYWLSWFISLTFMNMLSALLMALVGSATSVDLFSECHVLVHTLAAFFFMSATMAFVMAFAAITKQAQYVQLTMFAVVLFSMILQFVLATQRRAEPPSDIWSQMASSSPKESTFYKLIFFFMPVYHYGKIIQNIYDVTGTEGGRSEIQAADARLSNRWPTYYDFGTIYDKIGYDANTGLDACVEGTEAHTFGCKGLTIMCSNATWTLPPCADGTICDDDALCDWIDFEGRRVGSWWIPSVHDSMWCLMFLTVVYLVLAWYLAQIFSAGTGSAKPPYFIFQPSYWMATSVRDQDIGDAAQREQELSLRESSCRLLKLSKSYATATALKELTLQMQENEIFCLLGHNGAGKSTTINLLTGLHPPTHGYAFVCGYSIVTNVNIIQSIMGVCPQDNVLFDGLTASSHMAFWGRFKGEARASARREGDRLLDEVALTSVKNKAAGAYSGGMKRRLSIAIASTACPRIVFLDEPTTGLDPLSRMRTWNSIMQLKMHRVVCLTTHSMEEAEALGDNVGILANARLRAIGTPLFLKGRFGRGYQLTIMGQVENSKKILKLVKRMLPSSEVISNEAGRIIVGVPKRIFHLFPGFFAKLEADVRAGKSMVDEWGLSAATLEEVFLKVAVANDAVNAEVDDMGNELYPGLALNTAVGETVMVTLTVAGKAPVRVNNVIGLSCEKAHGPAPMEDAAQPLLAVPDKDDGEGGLVGLDEDGEGEEDGAGKKKEKAKEALEAKDEEGDTPESTPKAQAGQMQMIELTVPDNVRPGQSLTVQMPDGDYVSAQIPEGAQPGEKIQVPYVKDTRNQVIGEEALLPSPDERFEQPSCLPALQVVALLRKSYTLQRKQWKANICRCCCVGFLVVVNMLLLLLGNLLAMSQEGFDNPCPANYIVIGPYHYHNFANEQQGTASSEEYPACREQDYVAFLVGEEQCTSNGNAYAYDDSTYVSTTWLTRNADCWRVEYFEWEKYVNWWCYGTAGCPVTHTHNDPPSTCPAGGGASFDTACAPREQLPDLCAVRGSQARTSANFGWDGTNNEWYALASNLPDQTRDAMSTATMWHDGNGMDASWFSGLVDERYVTMARQPNDTWAITSNESYLWDCGSSKLELRQVSSIPDVFMERQRAKKSTERSVDTFECSGIDDDAKTWPFRNILGIDTRFMDAQMPYDPADEETVINTFFDDANDFPDLGISLQSADVAGEKKAAFDMWVYGQDWENFNTNSKANLRLKPPYPYAQTAFKLTDQGPSDCAVLSASSPTQPGAVRAAITALHNGLFFQMGATEPVIKSTSVPLPEIEFRWNARWIFMGITVMMLPILSMLYFPVMTTTIQQERAERNVMAMQMQSLKLPTYWVATYIWNTFLYWTIMTTYYIFGVMSRASIFTDIHHGNFILILALWCHSQICLATFLASLLGGSKLSTLLTYAIVLTTVIMAPIFWNISFSSDEAWSWYILLVGPFNFIRSFIIVLNRGTTEYSDDETSELILAFMLQFFFSLALFIAGIVIHMMLSNEVTASVLRSRIAEKCGKRNDPAGRDQVVALKDRNLDGDVEEEATRVQNAPADAFTVRVQDLEKVYPGGYRAVRGVSFGIEVGECFGLLGPNGAGKTTIISMLSASTAVSAGEATVCGLDVQKNQGGVYQNLGICPQFDIYWRDATVMDHLLLFARLKGIPKKSVYPLVTRVAEAVGLGGDPFRMPAEALSGGQRRRLSLGIALVANPKVVFLDEPSTGLDPQTRQGLWRIVSNMRNDRAVVLTTHSMEEADALCHRIGIMAKGLLRCIGTGIHLKNKFGKGYLLSLSLERPLKITATDGEKANFAERMRILDGFIKKEICLRAIEHKQQWTGSQLRIYELPVEGLKVSRVFEALSDETKKAYGIQQWSLNQTTLNDVFMRIAQQAEEAEKE